MPDIVLIIEAAEKMCRPVEQAIRTALNANYNLLSAPEVQYRTPNFRGSLNPEYAVRIAEETANAAQRRKAKFACYVSLIPLQVHETRLARAAVAVADSKGLAGFKIVSLEDAQLSPFGERLIAQTLTAVVESAKSATAKRTPEEARQADHFANTISAFNEILAVPITLRG